MIGSIITSMGAIISLNTTQPNKYYFYPGIAITLYGSIVSFLSFNKASRAGHELIKAGEELEKEKSV